MKKNIYFSAFAASLLAMGFTSCSNEDFAGVQQENGTVRMTVGISKADLIDGETRTSLSENSKGDLDCVWEADDRIMVSSTDGKQIHGYLTVLDGVGESFAHFSCENLVGLTDNTKNLTFTYLGRAHNSKDFKGEYESFMYTKQEGTMSSLSNQDLLVGKKVAVSVADGEAYAENISLQRPFAFGHFTLVFPEGVKRTSETVTISGTGIQNMVTYRPDGSIGLGANGGISINGNTGNDLYVIFPLQNTEAITPTFTVTVGGKDYSATLTERTWKAGEYVRKAVNEGVPVVMETDEPAVDHSKNPLEKWAKYNLQYNTSTKKSSFVSSETSNGSLYQWGRNRGFSDYNEALGGYDSSSREYNYYVVGYNAFVHAGLRQPYILGEDIGCAGPKGNITSSSDLKNYKDYWIMNSNTNQMGSYTYAGEYWAWSNGGSNWTERAEKQGYEMNNLLPDDTWRIPTVADFKEIMPKTDITSSSSLTNALKNKSAEIRTNADCKYAIRWSKSGNNLKIEAIVLADDVTSITSDIWNDSNVKVRIFPLAGAIRSIVTSYYAPNLVYDFLLDKVAVPMPLGDILMSANIYKYDAYNWIQWASWSVQTNHSSRYGAYWASDAKQTFTIVENSGWTNQTTQFKMTTQNAHNGYSIRLIKK